MAGNYSIRQPCTLNALSELIKSSALSPLYLLHYNFKFWFIILKYSSSIFERMEKEVNRVELKQGSDFFHLEMCSPNCSTTNTQTCTHMHIHTYAYSQDSPLAIASSIHTPRLSSSLGIVQNTHLFNEQYSQRLNQK